MPPYVLGIPVCGGRSFFVSVTVLMEFVPRLAVDMVEEAGAGPRVHVGLAEPLVDVGTPHCPYVSHHLRSCCLKFVPRLAAWPLLALLWFGRCAWYRFVVLLDTLNRVLRVSSL